MFRRRSFIRLFGYTAYPNNSPDLQPPIWSYSHYSVWECVNHPKMIIAASISRSLSSCLAYISIIWNVKRFALRSPESSFGLMDSKFKRLRSIQLVTLTCRCMPMCTESVLNQYYWWIHADVFTCKQFAIFNVLHCCSHRCSKTLTLQPCPRSLPSPWKARVSQSRHTFHSCKLLSLNFEKRRSRFATANPTSTFDFIFIFVVLPIVRR